MLHQIALLLVLVLPFAGCLAAALLETHARNAAAWLAGAVTLIAVLLLAALYPRVTDGGVVSLDIAWVPQLGLQFGLRLDGFSWMFGVLVTGIGLLVVLYARYYMSPSDPVPRFFAFLLAFMGAMLGIVLSGNLIQLVFFWELTSLFSFLLIGYWHQRAAARDGARMSLTITSLGGLCLFAGVLVLGHIVGSYDLDVVLRSGDLVRAHPLYFTALVLIVVGALTKSAQFPFHFWLPQAMAAPTPVSAYLHSVTLVKAGVFLLARLWPVLSGTNEWLWLVSGAGLVTFVLGAFVAIFQQDVKGLLAYSTISHIGLITLLLGLGTPLAAVAAIFHIMNHATFKASLFMAAGIIDHETGTRDIRRLSGLFRYMPITGTLAMVAAASMAGVPLLNGFLSKEMFFARTIETHDGSLVDDMLPYVATLAAMFSVAYSLRFIHGVFFGPPPVGLPRTPHEPPHWMRLPVEILVLVCLVVGIIPGLTVGPYLATAVTAVLGGATPVYSLAVWHGFNLPLLMSVFALAGGVALYFMLQGYLARGVEGAPLVRHLKAPRIFDSVMVTLSWRWARSLEGLIGTRRLQPQLRFVVCVALVAGLWPILDRGLSLGTAPTSGFDPVFTMIWLIGVACAISGAALAKFHRLAALVLIGGAGLATCITFVWLSAPDLALTQLLVEIVTTVLILLGLRWLPKRVALAEETGRIAWSAHVRRVRDLVIALAAGGGLATISYLIMTRTAPESIADYFVENAYALGGGRNVVNVILVDFRGFDTLGEITVLAAVALTVYALLRRFRPASDSIGVPEQQQAQDLYAKATPGRGHGDTAADYLVVTSTIMKMLFPVIGVMGLYLFLRGHDLPGGGFVGGITLAIAVLLQYLAGGIRWVEARLRIHPVRWIASGLILATATGAGSWLFSYPFLTSHSAYADLPLIGSIPLVSALLFDLGVMLLVIGAITLILIAIAHQSIRSHRNTPPPAPPTTAASGA
ncbi:monovalent cation/H+ antiporter subunit A [Pseudoxanthobacter sp. M-2]|uniref:monovalent cation/H+ antiporter subunit A n=1 Tax=Pseudoxanthobacter sp. M-2 TaxID=3078754 RepID=UPI0038FC8855